MANKLKSLGMVTRLIDLLKRPPNIADVPEALVPTFTALVEAFEALSDEERALLQKTVLFASHNERRRQNGLTLIPAALGPTGTVKEREQLRLSSLALKMQVAAEPVVGDEEVIAHG